MHIGTLKLLDDAVFWKYFDMLIYIKNSDKYGSKTYPLKRERVDQLRIEPMDPCIGFIGFDPDICFSWFSYNFRVSSEI